MTEKELMAELYTDINKLNKVIVDELNQAGTHEDLTNKKERKMIDILNDLAIPNDYERVFMLNEKKNKKEQLKNLDSQLSVIKSYI